MKISPLDTLNPFLRLHGACHGQRTDTADNGPKVEMTTGFWGKWQVQESPLQMSPAPNQDYLEETCVPEFVHVFQNCEDNISILAVDLKEESKISMEEDALEVYLQSRRRISLFVDDDEEEEESDDDDAQHSISIEVIEVASKKKRRGSFFSNKKKRSFERRGYVVHHLYEEGRFLYEI